MKPDRNRSRGSERFLNKRVAVTTVTLIGLVSAFLLSGLPRLEFDYDYKNFFPPGHPETRFYYEFREQFGTDNDFVLIGLKNRGGIFEKAFLKRAHSLVDSLKNLRHIREVISIVNAKEPVRDPLMGTVFERKMLRWQKPALYERDSARLWERPGIVDNLVSSDGRAMLIYAKTTQFLSKKGADEVDQQLQRLKRQFPFDEIHLAGRAVAQSYYLTTMREELVTFFVLSLAMVLLFLTISFRSWWAVLVPVVVVLLSTLWLLGFMGWIGEKINLIQTILPTIMFVVGMSDVVHILSKYLDELRKGEDKHSALGMALREIGLATFLTSLTTAVGFLTLLTTGIIPIMDFGIFTAIGVFLAYLLAYSLFPAVIILVPPPGKGLKDEKRSFWNTFLHRRFLWTMGNKRGIIGGFMVLVLLGGYGVSKLDVNSRLLADLKKDDPLRVSFSFLEEHFSGVRPFEMVVQVRDSSRSVFDPEVLREMEKLQGYLKTEYGVGGMVSPVTLVKESNRAFHGGDSAFYRVPGKEKTLERIVEKLEEFGRERVDEYIARDGRWGRVQGRMKDVGTRRIDIRNDSLRNFYQTQVDTALIDYELTGAARLIDLNNDRLVESTLKGLMIAFLVIGLVVALMFRSWKMVVVTVIPNVLPLVFMGAVMGFFGIGLKLSTSIIFAIAFGIAVDDTIHFVSRLRLELNKGRSFPYALKRTYISTGKAILVTTVILCGGFFSLIFSEFLATFYIGVLIFAALGFAVLSDLLLLPVLLVGNRMIPAWRWRGKDHKKKGKRSEEGREKP